MLASALPYLGGLGFYSDDWGFLDAMGGHNAYYFSDGYAGLSANPNLYNRPVHQLQMQLLFTAFGMNPLGYHVTTIGLLAAAAVLLHACLRRLGVPAFASFAIAMVFALSPSYSTDRFWFSSSGYVLMMAAYFLSTYADLRGLEATSTGTFGWRWKPLALVGLALCGLGHEIATPLLAGNLVVLLMVVRRRAPGLLRTRAGLGRTSAFLGGNVVLLAAVLAFKASTAVGSGLAEGLLTRVQHIVVSSGFVHVASYGAALPSTAWWAISRVGVGTLLLCLAIGLAVAAGAAASARRDARWPSSRAWLRLLLAGAITLALGYAIFLTNPRFHWTSTGLQNRINIAGALGMAVIWIAAAGLLAGRFPSPTWTRRLFAGMTGLLCAAFAVTVAALSGYWTAASSQEQAVIAAVQRALPDLRPGATVIISGQCPYLGPAIVFEGGWDTGAALSIEYREPEVSANVVSPRMRVGEEELTSTVYGAPDGRYPYGDDLYLYDVERGTVRVLSDRAAAESAIAPLGRPPVTGCTGEPGQGQPVLPFDELVLDHLGGRLY